MATPTTPPVRFVTGTGDDLDAAWVWFRATLAPLPEGIRERTLKTTPALVVLMSYRTVVARSRALPPA
jgi:hypothetical protein